MGIINFARNLETRQAYELGKGSWKFLADTDGFIDASDVDALKARIGRDVIKAPQWEAETVANTEYHGMIAADLHALGSKLELVDDTGWSDPLDGFELIGSRYGDV